MLHSIFGFDFQLRWQHSKIEKALHGTIAAFNGVFWKLTGLPNPGKYCKACCEGRTAVFVSTGKLYSVLFHDRRKSLNFIGSQLCQIPDGMCRSRTAWPDRMGVARHVT